MKEEIMSTTRVLWVVIVLGVMGAGCVKRGGGDGENRAKTKAVSCRSLNERNKTCMNDILKEIIGDDYQNRPNLRKKIELGLKGRLSGEWFLKTCKEVWISKQERDRRERAWLVRCNKTQGCKAYARCIAGPKLKRLKRLPMRLQSAS